MICRVKGNRNCSRRFREMKDRDPFYSKEFESEWERVGRRDWGNEQD